MELPTFQYPSTPSCKRIQATKKDSENNWQ
jgi:hypothetical protein